MIKKILFIALFLPIAWTMDAHDRDYDRLRDSIVEFSKQYLGCRYAYASKGPKTFDCSGFTSFVFKHFNYTLNASSATQYTQGEKVKLSKAKRGDLIFFKGSNANSNTVGHVGMITDVKGDTVQFIHAAVKGGVRFDTYPGVLYYNIRFIGCKRIFGEVDSDNSGSQDEHLTEPEVIHKEEAIPSDQKEEECKEPEPAKEELKKETKEDVKEEPKEETQEKEKDKKEKRSKKEKKKKEKTKKEEVISHTIKKGETLYRLSIQYGCTVEEIQRWNNLKSTNLRIGQEIIIKKRNTK